VEGLAIVEVGTNGRWREQVEALTGGKDGSPSGAARDQHASLAVDRVGKIGGDVDGTRGCQAGAIRKGPLGGVPKLNRGAFSAASVLPANHRDIQSEQRRGVIPAPDSHVAACNPFGVGRIPEL